MKKSLSTRQAPVFTVTWLPQPSFANMSAEIAAMASNLDMFWENLEEHWEVPPRPAEKAYIDFKKSLEQAQRYSEKLAAEIRKQNVERVALKGTRKQRAA